MQGAGAPLENGVPYMVLNKVLQTGIADIDVSRIDARHRKPGTSRLFVVQAFAGSPRTSRMLGRKIVNNPRNGR